MKICVVRLSAMGDVAMSLPVLHDIEQKFPEAEILFLTRSAFTSIFSPLNNTQILSPDLYGKHKGIIGLFRLFREIKKQFSPDIFIDIHDVLRTKILRSYFKISGVPVYVFDKGKKEKKQLTRQKDKINAPLKHTVGRYAEAFEKAGFALSPSYTGFEYPFPENFSLSPQKMNIGFSPFAAFPEKTFPLELCEAFMQHSETKNMELYIFGGGKKEQKTAEKLAEKHKNVHSLIGKYWLGEEIGIMSRLDAVIAPDSGNMHLSALCGTPVVSVWGATHPFTGFMPFIHPDKHRIVQNTAINCRPCSVFGNKACYKTPPLECLNKIKAQDIFDAIDELRKGHHTP